MRRAASRSSVDSVTVVSLPTAKSPTVDFLPVLPWAMARNASRSVKIPVGFPPVMTTAEPTPRSIMETAASRTPLVASTVSTARVTSGPISMALSPSVVRPAGTLPRGRRWATASRSRS